MTRIRHALGSAARGVAGAVLRLAAAFKPEEGTTEGAVMLGLLLLAAAFLVGGHPDWALGVPGGLLVLLGSGPFIASIRRRD